ncbi:hypothetical protein [Paenibacillus soyae]|uniref:Uncharacterized protein n=1 Tax=Paenibacillus soyae TaxID=2969249 RepID=A0A9X2MUD3_9BACL|nr:hypothetical protein [Paenibacillus soyae]MCR2805998.1 hypothetical protein [Paenibacillus soyae]
MPEPADRLPQAKSTAPSPHASRASSEADFEPRQAFSKINQGHMTPAAIMQLQRTAGNQAVVQLFRERSGAVSGSGPPAQPHVVRPGNLFQNASAGAASAEAVIATPSIPADLKGKGGYADVYGWLKEQANASKKSGLFGFFDVLSPEQKMSAIRSMAGGARSISVEAVKKIMMTGLISKSVDWDKFSVICRQAKMIDTNNYNADQDRDYASYAAIGTSGAAGGVSGSATISKTLGAGGATGTALVAAPIAGGLSGVAAVSQIYNATQNYDGAMSAAGKAQIVAGEGASGAADLARFSAGTVNGVREVSGMALNGAATVAAGAGAIVGGAAYMVGGAAGYIESGRNAKKLGQLEEELTEKEGDETSDKKLLAANLGRSTQEMNKSKSGMTAVKGAMMIAGGAMLIAAAASPAGPILIALAAILGGVAAVVKFYKKYKRKEMFVDKALKVEEAAALPENQGIEKSQLRQALLEKHGFNSVGQCYAQLVTDLASMLYESGVAGEDKESIQIIEGIGLRIDKEKKAPSKEMIAKKLHT